METTSNHRCHRCSTTRSHHRARVYCRGCWHKQAETQNGIQRGLNAKADPDRDDVPAIEQEDICSRIPALCPRKNTEVYSCNKRGTNQKCKEGNKVTSHKKFSFQF